MGSNSGNKVLALKVGRLKFNSPEPTFFKCVRPPLEKQKQIDLWGSLTRQPWLVGKSQASEWLCLKIGWWCWGKLPEVVCRPSHIHKHMYLKAHKQVHAYTKSIMFRKSWERVYMIEKKIVTQEFWPRCMWVHTEPRPVNSQEEEMFSKKREEYVQKQKSSPKTWNNPT